MFKFGSSEFRFKVLKVQSLGSEFRVQSSKFRVQKSDPRFKVPESSKSSEFEVEGLKG